MRPGDQIREYILDRKVGEGGMAEVWLGRHVHLDKAVALKMMSVGLAGASDFGERFIREARAMARLQHPNILSATDFFAEGDTYFLVMPFIDAGSLEDRIIAANGPVPIDLALGVSYQILAALDFAHQKGVIHRDVKPSNILMDLEGRAYLADFGIALMVGDDRKTRTGTSIGTPHYMSPEQIMRPKAMDHRADVYSYGCVLYEMLVGRPPFDAPPGEGDTDFVVKSGHLQQEPPLPRSINPALPEALEQILIKVLQKDPDNRYQGCGELSRALEEFQQAAGGGAPRRSRTVVEENDPFQAGYASYPVVAPASAPSMPTAPGEKSGKTWLVAAVAAVVLIVIGGGGWYWTSRALLREFDAAVAQNNLVSGPITAYGAYQKAIAEKGADSGMVKEMTKKAYPLLNQKSQAFLDYFARESELPADGTWEDFRKIREWMNRIQPDSENNAFLEYALARTFLDKSNPREAMGHMQAAMNGKPNWVLAVTGMGRISMTLQDKDGALRYYEQAYRLDPNWAYAAINLANIVSNHLKDYPRAEGLYREAIRLAPDRPTFHWYLATHFFTQGAAFYSQACEEYKIALNMPVGSGKGLSPQAENSARQRINKICGG